MPNINVQRHEDAHSIVWEWVNMDGTMQEPEDVMVGSVDEHGNELEIPFADAVKQTQEQGMWGFYNQQTNTIHLWEDGVPFEELIYFFAHEVGHTYAQPTHNDPFILEELICMRDSQVAMEAYLLAQHYSVSK